MRFIPDKVAVKFARQALVLEKQSPGLLFGVGVVGVLGGTVLACRATLKLDQVLQEAQNDLNLAKSMQHEKYSEEDRSKDVAIIYTRTAVKVVKLYGPAIILEAASIGALAKSHNILTQRNAALTAAYVALDKGFREYRGRVVKKYGEQTDREFRYGHREEKIPSENPKEKPKTLSRVADGEPSIYARFFDPLSPSWNKEAEFNLIFLRCQQNYANDLLRSRGHLFLNEVYNMLGIPHSQAGAVVGWALLKGTGDNFVDFGIFEGDNQVARDFVNGREGAILLDFNVDGVIYDIIDDKAALTWQG
jgi:Family of unknown function (DUF6353)